MNIAKLQLLLKKTTNFL